MTEGFSPPRLLFDENLPRRLVRDLSDVFPASRHVVTDGLCSADDDAVWNHAIEHDLVIVSKDSDFHQLSFLRGAPPKVVWLSSATARPTRWLTCCGDVPM